MELPLFPFVGKSLEEESSEPKQPSVAGTQESRLSPEAAFTLEVIRRSPDGLALRRTEADPRIDIDELAHFGLIHRTYVNGASEWWEFADAEGGSKCPTTSTWS